MKISVYPSSPSGNIKAISSKSVAHRLLICAAFADKKTVIRCDETNKDIDATVNCLSALGAKITRNSPYYEIEPINTDKIIKNASLPVGESGSTLRFLLPVVAAIGADASFLMEGRLPQRPLSPLDAELTAHGINLLKTDDCTLKAVGTLEGDSYSIAGNVSSQFISGLLFALALRKNCSTVTVIGNIESEPYINMTVDALSAFGVKITKENNVYTLHKNNGLTSPLSIDVEGDWSNAAFALALGAIGNGTVCINGLNKNSHQGDMKIIDILTEFGANITPFHNGYICSSSSLSAIDIDASQIPDLVPVLATVASVAKGKTTIYGASRLRLKESDRIESVYAFLSAIGAEINTTSDGLVIIGKEKLNGGTVDSYNDHRIAMSAAVAACVCRNPVTVLNAEAVNKSYPSFWNDLKKLNIICE